MLEEYEKQSVFGSQGAFNTSLCPSQRIRCKININFEIACTSIGKSNFINKFRSHVHGWDPNIFADISLCFESTNADILTDNTFLDKEKY